jgi:pantoate--beta-alanine ligase
MTDAIPPAVLATCSEIRSVVEDARRRGQSIGLVPTMGALHEGHLSLVRRANSACDRTIVTIFVNPTQFGPGEDFSRYPRTLDADLKLLAAEGVDDVFAPANDELYPPGHSTFVEPPAVALPLEGRFRPGHFRGVATIVLKLFNIIPADVAFFGQKDYQQSLVIRRMVADLNAPIRIEVCPTVREGDGLALSSRNRYLSAPQRQQALAVSRALFQAKELIGSGQRSAEVVAAAMRRVLQAAGIERIDYAALCDPETLADRTTLDQPTIALIAAHVGNTRLIDNLRLDQ